MILEFVTVAYKVASIFFLILVGFICGKARLIRSRAVKTISDIVLYVASPAAILLAFANEVPTAEKNINLILVFVSAVIIHLISILAAHIFIRKGEENFKRAMRFATVFSNCGFMAFPVQRALFGNIGVFYGAMFVVVFNVFLWTYGVTIMSGDKKFLSAKSIIANPVIIATVLSLVIYAFQIKLPPPVTEAVTHLSNLNTPLPMLLVGYYLSVAGLGKAFCDFKVYPAVFLRMAVVPAVSIGFMYIIGMRGIPLIASAAAVSAPTAASTSIFATKFDGDNISSVNNIALATVLSLITMPLFIALAQII